MIPRILHFCYFSEGQSLLRFPLYYYLAIRTAMHWIRPETVLFHLDSEPVGPYWDAIRPSLEIVPTVAPDSIYGRRLNHPAHKSDVVRLNKLLDSGGVYLDLDTVCRKPWDDLFKHPAVLGLQENLDGTFGLCNAVVMSEPGNSFLSEWLGNYRDFSDDSWDEFSVRLPLRMARVGEDRRSGRTDVHVEPPGSFFKPSCIPYHLKDLFEKDVPFPDAYGHHLWDSMVRDRYCSRLTEKIIREVDTSYNKTVRDFLPGIAA